MSNYYLKIELHSLAEPDVIITNQMELPIKFYKPIILLVNSVTNTIEQLPISNNLSVKSLDSNVFVKNIYHAVAKTELVDIELIAVREGSTTVQAYYITDDIHAVGETEIVVFDPWFRENYQSLIGEYDQEVIGSDTYMDCLLKACMEMYDIYWAYAKDLKEITDPMLTKSKFLELVGKNRGLPKTDFSADHTPMHFLTNQLYRELLDNLYDLLLVRGTALSYEMFFGALGYDIKLHEYWYDRNNNLVEINPLDENDSSFNIYDSMGQLITTNGTDFFKDPRIPNANNPYNYCNKSPFVKPELTPKEGYDFPAGSFSFNQRHVIRQFLEFLRPEHIKYLEEIFNISLGEDIFAMPYTGELQIEILRLFMTTPPIYYNNTIPLNQEYIVEYNIGDEGPAGGLIFWADDTFYLEAAPEDEAGFYKWSNTLEEIGTTETEVLTGYNNTLKMLEQDETAPAALICNNKELNGYDDWFLPSQDELNLMYENLYLQELGNFDDTLASSYYWTSSEYDANNAYYQYFYNGAKISTNKESAENKVRAIRKFSKYINISDWGTHPEDNPRYLEYKYLREREDNYFLNNAEGTNWNLVNNILTDTDTYTQQQISGHSYSSVITLTNIDVANINELRNNTQIYKIEHNINVEASDSGILELKYIIGDYESNWSEHSIYTQYDVKNYNGFPFNYNKKITWDDLQNITIQLRVKNTTSESIIVKLYQAYTNVGHYDSDIAGRRILGDPGRLDYDGEQRHETWKHTGGGLYVENLWRISSDPNDLYAWRDLFVISLPVMIRDTLAFIERYDAGYFYDAGGTLFYDIGAIVLDAPVPEHLQAYRAPGLHIININDFQQEYNTLTDIQLYSHEDAKAEMLENFLYEGLSDKNFEALLEYEL